MPECRVVPCYKMFLKELKDIMSTCPLNISLSSPGHTPGVDVEHITIANRHSAHNTSETVNRGVQTSGRLEMKRESPIFHSRLLNRQVVSEYDRSLRRNCQLLGHLAFLYEKSNLTKIHFFLANFYFLVKTSSVAEVDSSAK